MVESRWELSKDLQNTIENPPAQEKHMGNSHGTPMMLGKPTAIHPPESKPNLFLPQKFDFQFPCGA